MKLQKLRESIHLGYCDQIISTLYGAEPKVLFRQKKRYIDAIFKFQILFPNDEDVHIFSAPGRSEIGGNHTDHQHGCALAAAVDLDVIAVVSINNDGIIRLHSEGYGKTEINLSDLSVKEEEKGTSRSLIRGIAAFFSNMGVTITGFDAYTTSDVLSGSGLSSSAAFETLIGTIIDVTWNNGQAGPAMIAKIGQYAENVYFGKNSGLLDQMVCSVGGFVFLDFNNIEEPQIEKYDFDFEKAGYALCITDTKGSHADLTGDYAAIPEEMKSVAAQFGKSVLREVDEEAFYDALPRLREACSDRALLRAMHFFGENSRAIEEAKALKNGDMDAFFDLYRKSGDSSSQLLQNLYSVSAPLNQQIPLGIAYSRKLLGDDGEVRVHGGGFAGTIQAFVPLYKLHSYIEKMNDLFGFGSCRRLRIRPKGGLRIV